MLFYFEYYVLILHYFASMKSYFNNAQKSLFLLILYCLFYNKVDILVIKSVGEYTE